MKDPFSKHILAGGGMPTFIFEDTEADNEIIDAKIESIKKKNPEIQVRRVDTTGDFPTNFLPTTIAGIKKPFVNATIGKMSWKLKNSKKASRSRSPKKARKDE